MVLYPGMKRCTSPPTALTITAAAVAAATTTTEGLHNPKKSIVLTLASKTKVVELQSYFDELHFQSTTLRHLDNYPFHANVLSPLSLSSPSFFAAREMMKA